MTRPIYGSRLILTAEHLAGVGAGRGRPALSDLRRATSTAYYALFHQLIRHGAFEFLPGATEAEAADVARWFSHSGVFAAAGLVRDAASSRSQFGKHDRTAIMAIRSASRGAIPPGLLTVADAFQSLQAARESADYDGNYDPVRAVTVNHIEDARAALTETRFLWTGQKAPGARRGVVDPGYRTVLRLALLKSGGPRGR
ncbi:MAG TPA: hypothetical protein VK053_00445 [Jiangellaceae bacterium]|nr:hypothetical protein [Jiangellaceae bacterium]